MPTPFLPRWDTALDVIRESLCQQGVYQAGSQGSLCGSYASILKTNAPLQDRDFNGLARPLDRCRSAGLCQRWARPPVSIPGGEVVSALQTVRRGKAAHWAPLDRLGH